MTKVLGIDIGGTNVKIGVVDKEGNILEKVKHSTESLINSESFTDELIKSIKDVLKRYPEIKKIGLGIPGLISKDRQSVVLTPNIPPLSGVDLIKILKSKIKGITFALENDANAAALGEFIFNHKEVGDNFLMVTLGTGVGGGAVIDGKVFAGGRGNALEIGHIYGGKGNSIEEEIGKKGIVKKASDLAIKYPKSKLAKKPFDAKKIAKWAIEGDEACIKVFEHVGKYLGQCIVSSVRILDIQKIVIGGGVSETYEIIEGKMLEVIREKLGEYYTKDMSITRATLGNEAGILGAASLVM